MSIFPAVQPSEYISTDAASLPLAREIAWDYEKNVPIYIKGVPQIVTGLEAVKVWAWKALHTERKRWRIYTWDYGSDIPQLIGKSYTSDTKQAEARRCVRDCLLINPYITSVHSIRVESDGAELIIDATIDTIYGETTISSEMGENQMVGSILPDSGGNVSPTQPEQTLKVTDDGNGNVVILSMPSGLSVASDAAGNLRIT